MNWAMPRAPAGETALGLKPDSAISCAASKPGETFQRDAERRIGSRYCAGTKARQPRAAPEALLLPEAPTAPDQIAGLRARRRPRDEAEVPGLPRIPAQEAEAPSVRDQPAVGRRGAEVELGRAAVQRVARRRHPARVRVAGEELRLLRVRAKAGDHDEVEARPPRGRAHPVVGGGDVRPHPLAVAIDERTGVPAALGLRRHPRPGAHRGGCLRDGARHHADRGVIAEAVAARESLRIDLPDDRDAGAKRRIGGGVGKGDPQAGGVDAVPPCRIDRSEVRPREVRGRGRGGGGSERRRAAVAGASSRDTSSRMLRTAESAARSAARCTRPLPVAAPPIAASASAARIRIRPAPSSAGSACPRRSARGCGTPPDRPRPSSRRAIRLAASESPPPGRAPASARRAASSPGSSGGDPRRQPSSLQLVHRERGERALLRQRDQQAPAGDRQVGLERRHPERARDVDHRSSASAAESRHGGGTGFQVAGSFRARWQRCPRAEPAQPAPAAAPPRSGERRARRAASGRGAARASPTSTSRVPAPGQCRCLDGDRGGQPQARPGGPCRSTRIAGVIGLLRVAGATRPRS